jgi:hypothetical protein
VQEMVTGPKHLNRGDPCGEEATRQPGGPAAHSNFRVGGRRVHLSERREEEEQCVRHK